MSRKIALTAMTLAFIGSLAWGFGGMVLGANWLVSLPLIGSGLALITMLTHHDRVAALAAGGAAAVMLVMAVISGFSIGLFLLPALALGIVATVAASRNPAWPPGRHNGRR